MNEQEQKKANIREMLVQLRMKQKMMKDSPLKRKFNSIFRFILAPNADLKKIIQIVTKLKKNANIPAKKMDGIDLDVQLMFWDDVINIIMETYRKNKEIK